MKFLRRKNVLELAVRSLFFLAVREHDLPGLLVVELSVESNYLPLLIVPFSDKACCFKFPSTFCSPLLLVAGSEVSLFCVSTTTCSLICNVIKLILGFILCYAL